ncbi:MAG: pseudouridine synthase [Breznakia sp.]
MMRLDKYLAHAKKGSRKEVKLAIRSGLVSVNHTLVKNDNLKINEVTDVVFWGDERVIYQMFYYIMLHKPQGYICSNLDEMYPSILHLINETYVLDLFSVGRLDVDTVGFVLLTNDGKFAHRITSPKHKVKKVYEVKLAKPLCDKAIKRLEQGVVLDDEVTQPAKLKKITKNHVFLHIFEGKYHQVKRMFHSVNNEVTYLKRVQIGSVLLDDTLKLGDYRALNEQEVLQLKGGALCNNT